MDTTAITAITGGIALITTGALIQVVRIFLKHIEKADARQDAAQERQETFLGNHMSANVRAQEANARASEKVADRLERLSDVVNQGTTVRVRAADEVEVSQPNPR